MLTENTVYLQQTMQTGFVLCFKTNAIAIVIVITFNVIVIDYIVILFIRNRNRADGK